MRSKTKNKKSREQIALMAQRAFDGIGLAPQDDAVHELTEGWFNASYLIRLADGREAVLKIAPPPGVEIMSYEQDIMRTEMGAMRRVAQNRAIPVPEIYFYDTAHDLCDVDTFFMAKLEGENYDHIKQDLPPEAKAKIDRQIGRIIRETNVFTGTYFGYEGNLDLHAKTLKETFIKIMESVLADGQRENAAYGYSVKDIREVYLRHVPALEAVTTPRLVHWDAWDPNFFIQEGRVTGLLDFERALWADPLMEAHFR